jgi:hypothetical protein
MIYPEYYRERAAEAEREAGVAGLPLVRQLYLEAARKWSQLAEHVDYVQRGRGEMELHGLHRK